MKYEIKDFKNSGDNKLVGLFVSNDNNNTLAIDKEVPLVDGETDAYYVQQAISLAQAEIDDWNNESSVVGKTFNTETGEFE